jgi:DNA-nicking Smr family endonuclease
MAERRKRGLTSEEVRLWRLYTQSVAPLRPAAPEPESEPPVITPAPPPPPPPIPRRIEPAHHAVARTLPELSPGQAIGLDKATAERLRRGELPVEGRLDLHGMTQVQAHEALGRFLATSQAQQRRCVLVITGKGWRPGMAANMGEGTKGVLRGAVPRWLNEAPNRSRVLAFATAKDRHGGGGALYVLIKRLR